MIIDPQQLLLTGATLFIAGLLQSIVGFGFTLVALPALLFIGLSLPEAVATCLIGGFAQRIFLFPKLRHHVDWRAIRPMMISGLIAIPVGIFVLRGVANLPPSVVRQVIGVIIILCLCLQWFGKIEPRDSVHKGWTYLAGITSGLLTGFANIGGPPVVLWILAHRFSQEKMRATCLLLFLAFAPFQIIILPIVFGAEAVHSFGNALLITPMVLLGSWIGLHLGGSLSASHVRISMQALLLVIAIVSLVKGFI